MEGVGFSVSLSLSRSSARISPSSVSAALVLLGAVSSHRVALAQDGAPPITGIEEPASEPGDTAKDFGNAVLWLPRHITTFLYWGANAAIAVVDNLPVVPRVQDVFSAPGGKFFVLPTVAETGGAFSVGARLITNSEYVASSLRVGFGGLHSFELESRVALRFKSPFPYIFSFEALHERDNDEDYRGVGQVPEEDARNQFKGGRAGDSAPYFEQRTRWIGAFAVRPHKVFEAVVSGSLNTRAIQNARSTYPLLSNVFEEGTLPGAFEPYTVLYGEAAARVDTRPTRGRPSAGVLAEVYAGPGRTFQDQGEAQLVRYGGRVAGFIPIYRATNILSPQVVVDGVTPVDAADIPFPELARQPDFRGIDDRRDQLSLVATTEYRWMFVGQVATRIFFDLALVARAWDELDFAELRWAAGMIFDLHSEQTQLGQLGFSAGPDGGRLLLTIGLSSGYGDRQHAD